AEIGRSLVRSGHSADDAQRLSRLLDERYAESNRDRMRNVFKDVPVIYGFSSKAPLGPTAASLLDRYFQSGSGGEIGGGRPSAKLLALFAPSSMTVTAGASDSDPNAGFRRDVCQFADDRLSSAERVDFVHQVMRRDMTEVRMFLDHLERYSASLAETERQSPSVSRALAEIAGDETARTRYLDFARDADQPAVRARMLELARGLGWLSPGGQRAELMRMTGEELAASSVSWNEVDLICTLNKNRELDPELDRLRVSAAQASKVGHAGILACLGNAEARGRMLRALTSTSDEEVKVAQVYLQHRPITDASELQGIATAIARMKGSDTQVRALDVLASYHLSDRESLDELTRLFPLAKSL